jgi:hypothetical protein
MAAPNSFSIVHVNPLPFVDFTPTDTAQCGRPLIAFYQQLQTRDTGSFVLT